MPSIPKQDAPLATSSVAKILLPPFPVLFPLRRLPSLNNHSFPLITMSSKPFAAAAGMLRSRLATVRPIRGGDGGPSRWTTPGTQERPNGYLFSRTPPPPGESRKWEDWELPCYITSFLTVVILGVGLNAKPDFTLETWAHQKALERIQAQQQQEAAAQGE